MQSLCLGICCDVTHFCIAYMPSAISHPAASVTTQYSTFRKNHTFDDFLEEISLFLHFTCFWRSLFKHLSTISWKLIGLFGSNCDFSVNIDIFSCYYRQNFKMSRFVFHTEQSKAPLYF